MVDLSVASHRFDCPLANHGGICTCPPGYSQSQVLGPPQRTEQRMHTRMIWVGDRFLPDPRSTR